MGRHDAAHSSARRGHLAPCHESIRAETGRPRGSSNPHRGIDFNYVGRQSARLNTSHPELRSPVNGVVERAGDDQWGTISIRDNNGLRHQILHTNSRKVKVGDVVAAGQVIGTMGNTGLSDKKGNPGHHHVHYQIKDLAGNVLDPGAFADALGPFDPVPAPAYIPEYKRYLQNADMMPRSRSKDVRVLRRMPAGKSDRSAFDSNDPAPIPAIPPDASFPSSTIPRPGQRRLARDVAQAHRPALGRASAAIVHPENSDR